jgi:hypothetical protein
MLVGSLPNMPATLMKTGCRLAGRLAVRDVTACARNGASRGGDHPPHFPHLVRCPLPQANEAIDLEGVVLRQWRFALLLSFRGDAQYVLQLFGTLQRLRVRVVIIEPRPYAAISPPMRASAAR